MSKKHTHKYFKMKMNGTKVWACALDCTHYLPKHMEYLIRGRHSICWQCGEEFEMDSFTYEMDKPICIDCNPTARNLQEMFESDSDKFVTRAIPIMEEPTVDIAKRLKDDGIVLPSKK